MFKLLSILSKPANMSTEKFNHYWQYTHGEMAKQLPGLVRYVQNHISSHIRPSKQSHQVNGFVELWFESRTAMEVAFTSDIGKQLIQDETVFIDDVDAYCVDEHVIYDNEL